MLGLSILEKIEGKLVRTEESKFLYQFMNNTQIDHSYVPNKAKEGNLLSFLLLSFNTLC